VNILPPIPDWPEEPKSEGWLATILGCAFLFWIYLAIVIWI
jgi:hypothetical protein